MTPNRPTLGVVLMWIGSLFVGIGIGSLIMEVFRG